ncbi:TPA: SymE family type I addiction module toxin [Enterobacter cancerogenus]|nr:SymE family type I addiction module toxin [Enterobacter cancerogenus]
MAKPECKSEQASEEVGVHKNRQLTVGYVRRFPNYDAFAALNLSGRWLEQAGFETGMQVAVTVEHGRLVIAALEKKVEPVKLNEANEKIIARGKRKMQRINKLIKNYEKRLGY